MLIDINQLSAKELYELAQRKEQEEAEISHLQDEIQELKGKRLAFINEHQDKLSSLDAQIQALNEERSKLIEEHESALDIMDRELHTLKAKHQSMLQGAENNKEETLPPATAPAANCDGAVKANDEQRLTSAIISALKGRMYISDSLLKEKLTSQGFNYRDISSALNHLVKNKTLLRKAGSNYVMG